MHSITYVPLLLMILIAGSVRFGQESSPGTRLVVSTQQELQDAIGSEGEAERIIKEILTERLTAQAAPRMGAPISVNVVAEQLPEAWLPTLNAVRIQRVPLAEARAGWERGCLSLLRVLAAKRENDLTLTVTEGHRCTTAGGDYLFDLRAQGWVRRGGFGGGFHGVTTDCPCRTTG